MPWPLPELNEVNGEEVYLGTSDGKPKVMFAVKTLPTGERIYRVIPLQKLESLKSYPTLVSSQKLPDPGLQCSKDTQ